jgi:hypothetical protein
MHEKWQVADWQDSCVAGLGQRPGPQLRGSSLLMEKMNGCKCHLPTVQSAQLKGTGHHRSVTLIPAQGPQAEAGAHYVPNNRSDKPRPRSAERG